MQHKFWELTVIGAIIIVLTAMPVIAQGNRDIGNSGLLVSTSNNPQAVPFVVEDGRSGAYITWMHTSEPPVDPFASMALGAKMQHVSRTGSLLFSPEGKYVSDHADTGQGLSVAVNVNQGVIVFWEDIRDGSSSIYAQMLSSRGALLWGPSGVAITDGTSDQHHPLAIPDGSGGAIVIWQDNRNDPYDLYAQRVDRYGNCLWQENGIPVSINPGAQISAKMSPDNNGGAVIVWMSNQDSGIGNNWDIYAQYIDRDGVTAFGDKGIAVCKYLGVQSYPRVVSDQNGGAFVAWLDYRNILPDVYANRLDENGLELWVHNGVNVSMTPNSSATMDMVGNNDDGVYISWSDHYGPESDIMLMSINSEGAINWRHPIQLDDPAGGIFHANPTLVKSKGDWVYVVWSSQDSYDRTFYAQRVDHRGNILWQPGGNVVASGQFSHSLLNVTLTKNFDLVTTWRAEYYGDEDKGSIYAQMLDRDGARQWGDFGIDP